MYCEQCVGNQARERCTIDHGIGILEVVRANVMSDVEIRGMAPVLVSEAAEPDVDSSDVDSSDFDSEAADPDEDVPCATCNTTEGGMVYHTMVDDRTLCHTCYLALGDTETEVDLTCAICNSSDEVNYFELGDGRTVCATCYTADDTLPGAVGMF
jgi:hypothetical protein